MESFPFCCVSTSSATPLIQSDLLSSVVLTDILEDELRESEEAHPDICE